MKQKIRFVAKFNNIINTKVVGDLLEWIIGKNIKEGDYWIQKVLDKDNKPLMYGFIISEIDKEQIKNKKVFKIKHWDGSFILAHIEKILPIAPEIS